MTNLVANPVVEMLIQLEQEPELFPRGRWPGNVLTATMIEVRRQLGMPCTGGCGETSLVAYVASRPDGPHWVDLCPDCSHGMALFVAEFFRYE